MTGANNLTGVSVRRAGFCKLLGVSNLRLQRCSRVIRGLDFRALGNRSMPSTEPASESVRRFLYQLYWSLARRLSEAAQRGLPASGQDRLCSDSEAETLPHQWEDLPDEELYLAAWGTSMPFDQLAKPGSLPVPKLFGWGGLSRGLAAGA